MKNLNQSIKNKYYILWGKDSIKETLSDTIKNGYSYYEQKYNTPPEIIECSSKDFKEEFTYLKAKVIPSDKIPSGTFMITGKELERDIKKWQE